MSDKRSWPRVRALKAARIIFNNGASTRDCTIRNLSAGGAKLVVETTVGIPDKFEISLEDGSRRECIVCWRKISEIGVKFLDKPTT